MSTPFAHPAARTSPVPARTSSVPPDPHPLVSPAPFPGSPVAGGRYRVRSGPDTRLAPGKRRQVRERLEISQYGR